MAFAVGALDEAIREYLLYRGFTQSLKFFDVERKDDRDKGFSFRVSSLMKEGGAKCALIRTHFSACQYENKISSHANIYGYSDLTIHLLVPGESYCGIHHAVCVQV